LAYVTGHLSSFSGDGSLLNLDDVNDSLNEKAFAHEHLSHVKEQNKLHAFEAIADMSLAFLHGYNKINEADVIKVCTVDFQKLLVQNVLTAFFSTPTPLVLNSMQVSIEVTTASSSP